MDPVTLSTTIARPREEVFEYLADVANHAEFTDHCLVDWHLTREDSYGRGAGGRFRTKSRFDRFSYGDLTLAEVAAARADRRRPAAPGASTACARARSGASRRTARARTRVEFTDRDDARDALRSRRWRSCCGVRASTTRCHRKALDRLRSILEAGDQRGARTSVSGGARKPASGFRL